jgi:polar amino acid transport system ATP-binding protein
MALVEVSQVVKRFGTNTVLDEIDLFVEEHQVVCLIGASGSGKSTLLRCINGLEAVQSGRIVVNGRKVIQDDIKLNRLRRDVGIVFQAFNLFPHMTVQDNITLAPRKVLHLDNDEAEERARSLLARMRNGTSAAVRSRRRPVEYPGLKANAGGSLTQEQ